MFLSALAPRPALAAPQYDDCDAAFTAFLGADIYQFSPAHRGELGTVRLYSLLSYQGAAAAGEFGRAFWRLEIRGPVKTDASDPANPGQPGAPLVRTAEGVVHIDADGQARAEYAWNGRDERGVQVAPGHYQYTFKARFLPDRQRPAIPPTSYEDLKGSGLAEAKASVREVIVNDHLDAREAQQLRLNAVSGVCQRQRNTPIETGFGYNFYYGSTHSHSNYSDGGQPTNNCASGNAYGSGTFTPASIYDYARNTAGLDYWVVNEHNHLIDDSVTTNNAPLTEAKVKQRYQNGLAAAAAATVNDAFIAVYGMEWGVLTNSDQGHVTLLETPVLFGWETCSNCTGA
ncbi:MAG TPA: hypothetical protein VMM92_04230, partial [Thermoanaerobaculia bacterium]|nr:hypothetical protein [Thermoanaerobaculia bacterium]